MVLLFFFFKQKTAYEMRISDWSSDVCSSDLAVLIERRREERDGDPLEPVVEALQAGASLILFPEGTRTAERLPQRFRGGLFRLAEAFPDLQLVSAYLDTLHRSMPKGAQIGRAHV